MRPFSFRLDKVLDLRATEEREEARALGEAHRVADAEREVLEESATHRDAARDQVAKTRARDVRAGTLRNLAMAVDAADEQAVAAQSAHDSAVARVEEQRERLAAARGERCAIERLRSRRLAAWLGEMRKVEQRGHDEVAARRMREGKE